MKSIDTRYSSIKEEPKMTLNIFFLTITIKKRKMSVNDAVHQEMVEKLYEKNKDQQISMPHFM